jgi:hypothetical protein
MPPPAIPPKTTSSPTISGEVSPRIKAIKIPSKNPVREKCKYFGARLMLTSSEETIGFWLMV